jgi:hypothetical protein
MSVSPNIMQASLYTLIMCGHYDRDPGLDKYLLSLIHFDKGHINQWTVTSSHVSGQKSGEQYKKGGLLPSVHHCQKLTKYEVDTNPIDLTHHAGVRGNFYRILPFEVTTKKGTKRGDFGIHLDANAPGSLGCIVMDWHNWKDFESVIMRLRHVEHVNYIPLYAYYS